MFPEEDGPAETAIGFTDQFVDAAIAKFDAAFGAGYTKENPQALAAYLTACASNINAFMTAATAIQDEVTFDEMIAAFEDEMGPAPVPPPPAPKQKRRRR